MCYTVMYMWQHDAARAVPLPYLCLALCIPRVCIQDQTTIGRLSRRFT